MILPPLPLPWLLLLLLDVSETRTEPDVRNLTQIIHLLQTASLELVRLFCQN